MLYTILPIFGITNAGMVRGKEAQTLHATTRRQHLVHNVHVAKSGK
jgi:hypothetical protein